MQYILLGIVFSMVTIAYFVIVIPRMPSSPKYFNLN
ncbi:hypothetical protein M2419_005085 [Sphingobacterium sp. BIGb0116]|nr:hypothetical protein [Sphingobacterium sp. BIGb0116]